MVRLMTMTGMTKRNFEKWKDEKQDIGDRLIEILEEIAQAQTDEVIWKDEKMKYRKKPVVIEAEQFDGTGKHAVELGLAVIHTPEGVAFQCDTLEGPLNVIEDDWIITGVKGEKYPCKPDIFEMTYDLVDWYTRTVERA